MLPLTSGSVVLYTLICVIGCDRQLLPVNDDLLSDHLALQRLLHLLAHLFCQAQKAKIEYGQYGSLVGLSRGME